ncbi:hypothetical protein ACWEN4_19285 [Streptomyces violaceorubidus]
MITPIVDPLCEETVVSYIRDLARLSEGHYDTDDWVFPTHYHLLLSHGRRFTATTQPTNPVGAEPKECYSSAARHARDDRPGRLIYAEGYALPHGGNVPVGHAWCVRPDGTVVDPTWADAPGRAYIGVGFREPQSWPYDGGGILQDWQRSYPLLKGGLSEGALLPYGRPL